MYNFLNELNHPHSALVFSMKIFYEEIRGPYIASLIFEFNNSPTESKNFFIEQKKSDFYVN